MSYVQCETNAAFARHCNCERMTIGNWLAGKPQVEALLLFQVADKCGVSPRWLLLGQGEMVKRARQRPLPELMEKA